MNDFFKSALYIDKYVKVLGSNTRIIEQDLYDADLRSFWKLISLSGSISITKETPKVEEPSPTFKETKVQEEKPKEEKEWEKLEQKVQDIPSKIQQQAQIELNTYLQEFDRLKNDVDGELIRLSNLYRIENLSSKKQQIAEKIKKLKNYKSSMNPQDLAEYVVMKLGGDVSVVAEILKARSTEQNPTQKEQISTTNFEPYKPIFDTLEKMSSSSLMLYLAKFEPETFKKYSLKQISEREAIERAKYYYLKQKGVPDSVISRYLHK